MHICRMRYDLAFLNEYCLELGLNAELVEDSLHIDLGEGAILMFVNAEQDVDCLVGFLETPWHFHGEALIFADPRGHYVELDQTDLIAGLVSVEVLICTRLPRGAVADRWLMHREYNDEFDSLEHNGSLLIRRASITVTILG